MIKYFRRIRQKMISEERISKYALYAFGEIVLVMVGILLALQINNWNVAKIEKEKEVQVLNEILSDLEYTLTDLDRVISERRTNIKKTNSCIQVIIDAMESDKMYEKSMDVCFRAIYAYDNIDFKTSGYQSLISIGADLIKDVAVRSAIGKFHSSTIDDVKSAFQEVHLDFYSYMLDYYRKHFNVYIDQDENELARPNDFENLKKDREYIQSLKVFMSVNKFYANRLNEAKIEATLIKDQIKSYLND